MGNCKCIWVAQAWIALNTNLMYLLSFSQQSPPFWRQKASSASWTKSLPLTALPLLWEVGCATQHKEAKICVVHKALSNSSRWLASQFLTQTCIGYRQIHTHNTHSQPRLKQIRKKLEITHMAGRGGSRL